MSVDFLYRYESMRYSTVVDAEREVYGTTAAKLECRKYPVTGRTAKGYWTGYFEGARDRWVSATARKRYAYPTKEEALAAYIMKKRSYVSHCLANLKRAEEDLNLGETDDY